MRRLSLLLALASGCRGILGIPLHVEGQDGGVGSGDAGPGITRGVLAVTGVSVVDHPELGSGGLIDIELTKGSDPPLSQRYDTYDPSTKSGCLALIRGPGDPMPAPLDVKMVNIGLPGDAHMPTCKLESDGVYRCPVESGSQMNFASYNADLVELSDTTLNSSTVGRTLYDLSSQHLTFPIVANDGTNTFVAAAPDATGMLGAWETLDGAGPIPYGYDFNQHQRTPPPPFWTLPGGVNFDVLGGDGIAGFHPQLQITIGTQPIDSASQNVLRDPTSFATADATIGAMGASGDWLVQIDATDGNAGSTTPPLALPAGTHRFSAICLATGGAKSVKIDQGVLQLLAGMQPTRIVTRAAIGTFSQSSDIPSNVVVFGGNALIGSWTKGVVSGACAQQSACPDTCVNDSTGGYSCLCPLDETWDLPTKTCKPKDLVAEQNSTCHLSGGKLTCWGQDDQGQLLGTGWPAQEMEYTPTPTNLSASLIALGAHHGCAVVDATTNQIQCWGDGYQGQRGLDPTNPAATMNLTPNVLSPPASVTGWLQLSAGGNDTCGIAKNTDTTKGDLYCFGDNSKGTLLQPDLATHYGLLPMGGPPVDPTAQWSQVSVANGAVCAIAGDTARTLYCWGDNSNGRVSTDVTMLTMTTPNMMGTGVTKVSVGDTAACAVKSDGTVSCWGTLVGPIAGKWLDVDVGAVHACGVTNDHGLQCWGDGNLGKIGGTSLEFVSTPQAIDASSGYDEPELGAQHSCARHSGMIECWGWRGMGQVGDGVAQFQTIPKQMGTGYTNVSVGGTAVCGIQANGPMLQLECWGSGLLGDGSRGSPTPIPINVNNQGVSTVSVGRDAICANAGGQLYCWGPNTEGTAGVGDQVEHRMPVQVPYFMAGPKAPSQISVNPILSHVCAVEGGTNTTYCWGQEMNGELGDNLGSSVQTTPVVLAGSAFKEVLTGYNSTCGLTPSNQLLCWGALNNHVAPSQILPVGNTFSGIGRPGIMSAFALDSAGKVFFVAGGNASDAGFTTGGYISISTSGDADACVLDAFNAAYCWGSNYLGQLGTGNTTNQSTPTPVNAPTSTFSKIVVGPTTTCAIDTSAQKMLWCWGDDSFNQLGDDVGWTFTPSAVN
jgi:alpha-tubulin suppressor-like RCC1 family protein